MSKYFAGYLSMFIFNLMIRVTWPEESFWSYFSKAVLANIILAYLFGFYA